MVVAALHLDLVHSDPGIPIEDLPYITGAMALVSFLLLQPKRWVCREVVPSVVFICLTLGLWKWTLDQYRRAYAVRVEHASLMFPGLYFPKDSLRYTFTALAETDRPEEGVVRELLGKLKEQGVPVAAQRVHFFPAPSSPTKTPAAK